MKTIIGIDPGKSGGISVLQNGGTVPLAHKMPETAHELADLLKTFDLADAKCYVEKVHSSPQARGSDALKACWDLLAWRSSGSGRRSGNRSWAA